MKELNQKGEQFYSQWEERRKKKWLFVFLHGSVYWGLPFAVAMFLWDSKLKIENMHLSDLFSSAIVFGIGGLWYGLGLFKRIDNIYLTLNDDDDVVKGIKTLKAGEIWNYENLIIHMENDKTLIVQNELFWFEENELPSEKLNECFNLVLGDFQRLQKNKDFDDFTKNKRVKIQIFDNSGSNIPLFEKII
jgi:hypothetical protein